MKINLMPYLIFAILTTVGAQSYSDIDDLHDHLFNSSGYNKYVRPLRNQSHVMQVNLTQYLTGINSFDIPSGELQIDGYFQITWNDDLLTWDPSLFGGKEVMSVRKDMIWLPKISIFEASDTENSGSLIDENGLASVWVDYRGFIVVVPAGSYRTRCDVDTTLFPFDRHKCGFNFFVANHGLSELVLYSPSGNLGTRYFRENGEWILEDETSEVKGGKANRFSVSMMETSFVLRRRAAFDFINTLSPALLMGFLNTLTCFIRPDSGERLSFAVTLYLALTFMSLASIEHIPKNSLKMPYLSYTLLFENILNTLSVCWSIFIVRLASFNRNASLVFPRLVRYIAHSDRRKKRCFSDKIVASTISPETTDESIKEYRERIVEEKTVIKTKKMFEGDNTKMDKESDNNITGLELALALDKIFFGVSVATLVLTSIAFCALTSLYKGK